MQLKLNRQKLAWGLGIALAVSFVVAVLAQNNIFQRLEWVNYDHRMHLARKQVPLHPDIAMVMVDEASLQAMNPLVGRWPWPRSVYADLLEFISLGGARAVVFDILFTENEKENNNGNAHPNGLGISDQRLVETTRDSGITTHAAQIYREEVTKESLPFINAPLPEAFRERFALPRAEGFPAGRNNNYSLPFDGLYQASHNIGVVGLKADDDGVYRRARLFHAYQGEIYPALSTAPLLDALQSERIVQRDGVLQLGELAVPLTADSQYRVNMVGDFKAYSISGIFASIQAIRAGEFDKLVVMPEEFANRIVYIGASAVGLEDLKTTPVSPRTPGVLIHASITSNLLSGDLLQEVSPGLTFALVVLFAFVSSACVLFIPRLTLQIGLPLTLALAYTAWTYWRFRYNQIYELLPPLAAIGFTYIAAFAYQAFTEGRDKRRVRLMLSQYVSPAMLSDVLDNYKNQLKAEVGTSEHLTILFSDVRSFTSISETLPPEKVVDLLNTHFSVMTEIIFNHDGTLDKFIGDAIMAFWGAPIQVSDHAERAVRAAIEMQRGLEQVNAQLEEKGYPPIRVGLGINTGNVILGNIGSERKLDYTVIGDNVNLASRLEGLTARYGCPVIISEYSYAELKGDIPCALVDMVRVKGKQVPLSIYWPMALPEDPPEELARCRATAELISRAFSSYTNRQWGEAEALYGQIPDIPLKAIFIERCQNYREEPPPEDWDGVFTLTSK